MAIVAKWLTHRIVAPALVGSIPIVRPKKLRSFWVLDLDKVLIFSTLSFFVYQNISKHVQINLIIICYYKNTSIIDFYFIYDSVK